MAGTKSSFQKKNTCMFIPITALMAVLKWTTDIIFSQKKEKNRRSCNYYIRFHIQRTLQKKNNKKTKKERKAEQELVVSWYWLTKYLQACFLTPVLQHSQRTLLRSSALRIFRTSTNLSLTVFLHLRARYQSHCLLGQRCLHSEGTLLPGTRKRA